ncbi:MAG: MgtC/SapB family protein [Lachnospiraceae bacterium]|jgi:putative Mg2+ transporter-C (MgtC) family protein|nr:MgtC/SapB family protein [Lachnospiraceae bacterium]
MNDLLLHLRDFTFTTVILRLLLAFLSGTVIGYGRARKQRSAGLRTFILTSIGAALTTLLATYEYQMLCGPWADVVKEVGLKFDGSRYSAQVISGIGFLAAGTIISIGHQQVSGLSTAAGLFASVCMGIAAGAGFYECVIVVLVILIIVLDVMWPLEPAFKRRLRNITVFVEFNALENLNEISDIVRSRGATIYDIEIERSKRDRDKYPCAILILKMSREKPSHSGMLSSIAELDCVRTIHELIS